MTGVKPTIVRNPANDPDFDAVVDELLRESIREATQFQDRLRARYPRAVVNPRELVGERQTIWYVYREGRWISGSHQTTEDEG